jgi:hypothetical protein
MAHPFYDKVIRALQECAVACSMCAVACLQEREVARMRDCILLDLDCADLCRTLIGMLGRTSEYSRELMVVCATLCDQCADVCEKIKTWNIAACALKAAGSALLYAGMFLYRKSRRLVRWDILSFPRV